jgi:hypothetical protein
MSRAASLMAILPVYQLIDFIDIYLARLQISIEYTSYGGGFAALWRYQNRSSQEYLTPGCQVLGGYKKLGTLPDMISSPGSHFAVLDHVKIM